MTLDATRNGTDHWLDQVADSDMQDDHAFIWRALLDTIDTPLAGTSVLDVGCNQGGFLAMLRAAAGIASGSGFDPAAGAIGEAHRLHPDPCLRFAASDSVPTGWGGFDVAFSHEVIYLLHDVRAHAAQVFESLRPGGVYWAVLGAHAANPLTQLWRDELASSVDLPPRSWSLEEVATALNDAGFVTSVGPIRFRFVPTSGHLDPDLPSWLDHYFRQKVIFRCARP